MDESSLERVVTEFWDREHDVLVCTTIVESGLDMPTVNTLVVDRADLLGLAQMYQLRGRVGRRGQRAYAYLLSPPNRALSEEAYERLKTIGEFTDLGSGFKIAMRDLEIRGAGNLLGAEQSGHIAAVGFDLYVEMVTEAVGELTGEVREAPAEVQIDLPITAHLPRDYIARDDVRMEAYRRLAAVTNMDDVEDVRAEWQDRYGPPPAPAAALLDVARLRAEALRLGARAVSVQKRLARFDGVELRKSQEARLKRIAPRSTVLTDAIVVPVESKDGSALLEGLLALHCRDRTARSHAGTIRVVTRRTPGRLVALVVMLVVIVVASGCSSTLRDAATVTSKSDDGDSVVHIRRDDFDDEVRALSTTPEIRQQLAQAGISESEPTKGTADARLSAFWLSSLIQGVAVQEEFESRGLELSDSDLEQTEAALGDLGDLDRDVKDKIVESQAMQQKLIDEIGASVDDPPVPSDAELRLLYEQNAATLTACASGKEVSHILVEDEATANAIAQELAAGANFSELARTRSTDGSASNGGSLGCLGAQPFVAEFQQAADSAPMNEVVGPVRTEFGYHLILVTPWSPSFEKFRDQIAEQATSQAQQQVEQQRSQLYGEAITERLDAMTVKIDPRYGSWDDESGQFQVVPPEAPNPREQREPTTTTTSSRSLPGAAAGRRSEGLPMSARGSSSSVSARPAPTCSCPRREPRSIACPCASCAPRSIRPSRSWERRAFGSKRSINCMTAATIWTRSTARLRPMSSTPRTRTVRSSTPCRAARMSPRRRCCCCAQLASRSRSFREFPSQISRGHASASILSAVYEWSTPERSASTPPASPDRC